MTDNSFGFVWAFGLRPRIQFGLVGGDAGALSQDDRSYLFDQARLIIAASGKNSATVGAGFSLADTDLHVVLLGLPATGVAERGTGRGGLSIVLGCGVPRSVAVQSAGLAADLIGSLHSSLALSIVGRVDAGSDELARRAAAALQDDSDRWLPVIEESAAQVSRLAGVLYAWVQPQSRLRSRPARRVTPAVGGASALELCRMLAQQLLVEGNDCYGGYVGPARLRQDTFKIGPSVWASSLAQDGLMLVGDRAWFGETFSDQ